MSRLVRKARILEDENLLDYAREFGDEEAAFTYLEHYADEWEEFEDDYEEEPYPAA